MKTRDLLIGLAAALLLALVISPFASSSPDGLERVAEDKGFLEKGEGPASLPAPIPDYAMPGIANAKLATSVAGVAGTLLVFGLGWGIGTLVVGRSRNKKSTQAGA
jgi:cobalt/nickel transport protein